MIFLLFDIDSGLSLTTVRDPNEIDSDHESKSNKEISVQNVKQYRSLITKKTNDDTDSDDVFVEVCILKIYKFHKILLIC